MGSWMSQLLRNEPIAASAPCPATSQPTSRNAASVKPPKKAEKYARKPKTKGVFKRNGPRGKKVETGIGPWQLSKAQARVIDLMCIMESNAEIAAYIGRGIKTVENLCQRAYAKMEDAGYNMDGAKRILARVYWQTYWRSEEGKANLRNVRLTQNPLA